MDYRMEIASRVAELTGLAAEELAGYIEIPPNPEMGDYAFPCFRLAKALRKAPPAIAADLAARLVLPAGVSRAEAAGGYLNFFTDTPNMNRDCPVVHDHLFVPDAAINLLG